MDIIKSFSSKKSDHKDLESVLKQNDLLDERQLWFAGYGDKTRDGRNSAAANIFYGNKNLLIIAVKENVIYFLKHQKNEFKVSILGNIEDKYRIQVWRNLIYPSIQIIDKDGETTHIQATKHKKSVYDFKKLVK